LEEEMTLMLTVNSLTPVPAFSHPAQVAPQIASTACIGASIWLSSALAQIREVEEGGELIPGIGDLRVAAQTSMRARKTLSTIDMQSLPAPLVAPVSGGGMSITWSVGSKEVKLAFDPHGEDDYIRIEGDDVIESGPIDLATAAPVTGPLKWMLDRV
jgi:hypothetical protein